MIRLSATAPARPPRALSLPILVPRRVRRRGTCRPAPPLRWDTKVPFSVPSLRILHRHGEPPSHPRPSSSSYLAAAGDRRERDLHGRVLLLGPGIQGRAQLFRRVPVPLQDLQGGWAVDGEGRHMIDGAREFERAGAGGFVLFCVCVCGGGGGTPSRGQCLCHAFSNKADLRGAV
jgi:hypothetical protein